MAGDFTSDRASPGRLSAYVVGKRVMDVLGSGIALAAFLPVCAGISLAVRLDSDGPALFCQERLGRRGRLFRMLKFRTMHAGSAPQVRDNACVVDGDRDPRLTRVGRWLRRWSIDELPQLWNVVTGDMSLVGPRPDLPEALAVYAPRERRRLEVRPGLTGLAQVSGGNLLSARERWELDARYVESMGFLEDLRIVARTIGVVVAGRTAPGTETLEGGRE